MDRDLLKRAKKLRRTKSVREVAAALGVPKSTLDDRKKPLNKRYPYAMRIHLWSPEGRISLEGPATKEGIAEVLAAAVSAASKVKSSAPKVPG